MSAVDTRAATRPGRPRSAAIDEAILDGAVEELLANGIIGFTMEGAAARAGVAKTTLYRRWSNTTDLALEAMSRFESAVAEPPEGSVRDQLVHLVDAMRRKWNNPRYSALMRRVLADANTAPELYRAGRDRLIRPHIAAMNAVLRRGVEENRIRADVDIDWVRQLFTAPIMSAALTGRGAVSRANAEFAVDTVLAGLAPGRSAG